MTLCKNISMMTVNICAKFEEDRMKNDDLTLKNSMWPCKLRSRSWYFIKTFLCWQRTYIQKISVNWMKNDDLTLKNSLWPWKFELKVMTFFQNISMLTKNICAKFGANRMKNKDLTLVLRSRSIKVITWIDLVQGHIYARVEESTP